MWPNRITRIDARSASEPWGAKSPNGATIRPPGHQAFADSNPRCWRERDISTAKAEQSSRPLRRSNCVYLAERDSLVKKTVAPLRALLFTALLAAPLAHIHAQA